jgi:hypothetical protein
LTERGLTRILTRIAGARVSSTGGSDAIGITGGSESGPIAVDPSNSNVFYVGDCCGPFTGAMSRFDRSGQSALGARRIDVWLNNPQGQNAGSVDQRFPWNRRPVHMRLERGSPISRDTGSFTPSR